MKAWRERWLRRSRETTPGDPAPLTVTLYSRDGCCLCHQALDLLRVHQRQHGFTITEVDIDTDETLVETYGTCVPVVAINDRVRFRGIVNPAILERLLKAEARAQATKKNEER